MKSKGAYNVGQQMPTPSLVPAFSGGLGDFFTGLLLPFRSVSMVFRSGKIFTLSLLASLVTAGALTGIVVAAWRLTERWVPEGTIGSIAHVILTIAVWIPAALTVPALVLAPLQDPISEATE